MKRRHGFQEVDDDEPKPLRDLGLARLVMNWLLDALVDLADVARSQRVGEIGCCLCNVPCGLHGALVWMTQALVSDVRPCHRHCSCRYRRCSGSGSSWQPRSQSRSHAPLISRVPTGEAVVRSAGIPGTAVHVAMNGLAAVARAATVPMAPLLRRRETRVDPVGRECPEMNLVGNTA